MEENNPLLQRIYKDIKANNLHDGVDEGTFINWVMEDPDRVNDVYEILDSKSLVANSQEEFYSYVTGNIAGLTGDVKKKPTDQVSGTDSDVSSQDDAPVAENQSKTSNEQIKESKEQLKTPNEQIKTPNEQIKESKEQLKTLTDPFDGTDSAPKKPDYGYFWESQVPLHMREFHTPKVRELSPEHKKRIKEELSLKNLRDNRGGNYDMSALEVAEANDPNPVYTKARNKRETVAEMAMDRAPNDPTVSEFKYKAQVIQNEQRLIEESIPQLEREIREKLGDDIFERVESFENKIKGLSSLLSKTPDETDEGEVEEYNVLVKEYNNTLNEFNELISNEAFDERNKVLKRGAENYKDFQELLKSDDYKHARDLTRYISELKRNQDNLTRPIDDQIKAKYGDDVFEKVDSLENKIKGISSLIQEGSHSEEETKKLKEEHDLAVSEYNQITSDDLFDKRSSPKMTKIKNAASMGGDIILKGVAKLVAGVTGMGESIEEMTVGNENYGAGNRAVDFFRDLADDAENVLATPSDLGRPFITTTGKWQELEVDFSEDGEIQALRDKDGYTVDAMLSEEQVAEIKGIKKTNQTNPMALAYQVPNAIVDLGIQLATTKGLNNVFTAGKLGTYAAQSERFARVSAYSSVTLSTMGQMHNQMYNKGLELFEGDRKKASQYSMLTTFAIGLSSNIFGLESKLATGVDGILGNLGVGLTAKGARAAIGSGALTVKDAIGLTMKHVGVSGFGEGIEEGIIEQGLEIGSQYILNAKKKDSFSGIEAANNFVPAFAVGTLFGGSSAGKTITEFQAASVLQAAKDLPSFENELRIQIKEGTITPKIFRKKGEEIEDAQDRWIAEKVEAVRKTSETIEAIPKELNEEQQVKVAEAAYNINELDNKAKETKSTAVKAAIEEEIQKEEAKIEEVINPKEEKIGGHHNRDGQKETATEAVPVEGEQVQPEVEQAETTPEVEQAETTPEDQSPNETTEPVNDFDKKYQGDVSMDESKKDILDLASDHETNRDERLEKIKLAAVNFINKGGDSFELALALPGITTFNARKKQDHREGLFLLNLNSWLKGKKSGGAFANTPSLKDLQEKSLNQKPQPVQVEPQPVQVEPQPVQVEPQPVQVEPAELSDKGKSHAKELGGTAKEIRPGVGIAAGYNMFGKPVYAPYNGDVRSNRDAKSFTGWDKLKLNEQDKKDLMDLRDSMVQEEKDNASKFGSPFKNNNTDVVVGKSVKEEVSKAFKGIKRSFSSLDGVNIIVVSDSDLNDDFYQENGLYGDYASVRSASTSVGNKSEKGSTRRIKEGEHYIYIDESLSAEEQLVALSHELGHIMEKEAFKMAPVGVKKKIREEYDNWYANLEGKTEEEVTRETRDVVTADLFDYSNRPFNRSKDRYISSFSEWFADNVSKFVTTNQKPKNFLEKFFHKLAMDLKRLYARSKSKNTIFPEMDQWLEGMFKPYEGGELDSNPDPEITQASPVAEKAQASPEQTETTSSPSPVAETTPEVEQAETTPEVEQAETTPEVEAQMDQQLKMFTQEEAPSSPDIEYKSATVIDANNIDTIQPTNIQSSAKLPVFKNIIKAAAKLIPNLEIVIHDSQDSLNKVAGTEGDTTAAGFYKGSKLHLLESSLSDENIFHEAIQPILTEMVTPESIDSLYEELKQTEAYENIQAFEKQYKGDKLQKIEALTEYMAQVAAGNIKPKASTLQKIKDFVYGLLESVGIKDVNLEDQSLDRLAITFSRALNNGRRIRGDRLRGDTSGARLRSVAEEKAAQFIDEWGGIDPKTGQRKAALPLIAKKVEEAFGFSPEKVEAMMKVAEAKGKTNEAKPQTSMMPEGTSMEKARKKFSKFRNKWIKAKGHLPNAVRRLYEQLEGGINAEVEKAIATADHANKLIKKYGNFAVTSDIMDEILRGESEVIGTNPKDDSEIETVTIRRKTGEEVKIPTELYDATMEMRKQVSNISKKLIDKGYAVGDRLETIEANLENYLNRSYRIWEDSDYTIDKVDANILNAAHRHLTKKYYDLLEARQKKENKGKRTWGKESFDKPSLDRPFGTRREVKQDEALLAKAKVMATNKINELFARGDKKHKGRGKKLGSKNQDIFKRRLGEEELPKEIRDLMGEYSDPIHNFVTTMRKISAHERNAEFLTKVKEIGMGKFLFTIADKIPKGFDYKISTEGSASMSPLAGYSTSKEIVQAFEALEPMTDHLLEDIMPDVAFLSKLTGLVNWNKTVGSYVTHMRNVFGNVYFMAANGYIGYNKDTNPWAAAIKAIGQDLGFRADKFGTPMVRSKEAAFIEDVLQTLKERGVIDQNPELSVLKDLFREKMSDDALSMRTYGQKKTKTEKVVAGAKAIPKKLNRLYRAEDDFFKILSFMIESQRYSKAIFGKGYRDLNSDQKVEIDEHVAEIVKNILPNYNKIGKAFQTASKSIFLSNFISFQVEAFRTSFNTVALAYNEGRSKNPKIRAIGTRRSVGMLTSLGLRYASMGIWSSLAGMGFKAGMGLFLDDDDEEKRRLAKNYYLPFNDKNQTVLLQYGDDKLKYLDVSAADPYGRYFRLSNALMDAMTDPESDGIDETLGGMLVGVAEETYEIFGGLKISADIMVQIISNQDVYGKDIFNPQDKWINQQWDKSAYLIEKGLLPAAFGQAKKLAEKFSEEGISAASYAAGQFAGMVTYEMTLSEQFSYKTGSNWSDAKSDVKKLYTSTWNNEDNSIEDIEKDYAYANEKYEEHLLKFREYYNAALEGGTDEILLDDIMKGKVRLDPKKKEFIKADRPRRNFNANEILFIQMPVGSDYKPRKPWIDWREPK